MISAIVCTYNRAPVLARMLESFVAQTCLDAVDHELIVVDNNSSDDTRAVAEGYAQAPNLRYVFEARQGLSAARNRGVSESRGDILAFLDDDVIVDQHWLSRLRECFDATHADVVGGRSYLIFDASPPAWFGPGFGRYLSEVDLGRSRQALSDGGELAGLNLAFRRSALEAAEKFDEKLGHSGSGLFGGEETVVVRRVAARGGIVVYDPQAVVGHIIGPDRLTWSFFRRLAFSRGHSCAMIEPQAGLAVRLLRILRGCGGFGLAASRLMRSRIGGRDSYEWRIARCDMVMTVGILSRRWKLLWRPPERAVRRGE